MYQVYQIGYGDTVDSIANKFGISVDDLRSLNNDINNSLLPGSFLVVPSTYNNFNKYTIKQGDSLYKIAMDNNVDLDTIVAINGLNKDDYIYPGEVILIPKEGIGVFMTKEGTTLDNLSNLGNMEDIYKLNAKIYLLPNQAILYKK